MEDNIPNGYARVTEVLNPFSTLHKLDPIVIAKAADRGRRVHEYCEQYALNVFQDNIQEDCKGYVRAFEKWFDEMVTCVHHSEVRINSHIHQITGRFDLIAHLKGDPIDHSTLIDIKTPTTSKSSWQLQTAAYQILIREHFGFYVQRRICLMLSPKGQFKIIEYLDHGKDRTLFLNALELYRFFEKDLKC